MIKIQNDDKRYIGKKESLPPTPFPSAPFPLTITRLIYALPELVCITQKLIIDVCLPVF